MALGQGTNSIIVHLHLSPASRVSRIVRALCGGELGSMLAQTLPIATHRISPNRLLGIYIQLN